MSRTKEQDFFRQVVALAPMATGGNLPYRRLCREYGAVRTCSEMIIAEKLVKGGDRPLLRHHESETDFGVQLTGKRAEVMADAARLAVEHGAKFIDLNFGCPIDLIVRRGAGAAMLKRPQRLAEIVQTVRLAVDVPLSVKLRLGYDSKKINVVRNALLAEEAGADAVVVHGRTRNQRYRLSADWNPIQEVAESLSIPVIGNGDILTCWDLEKRRAETSVSSFLVARGALLKPWIFQELAEGQAQVYNAARRWSVLQRYFDFACEYFGDDDHGMKRVERFFLWHQGFWHRVRNWTEDDFHAQQPESLIQARAPQIEDDPELALLASNDEADHKLIWRRLLDRDYPTE